MVARLLALLAVAGLFAGLVARDRFELAPDPEIASLVDDGVDELAPPPRVSPPAVPVVQRVAPPEAAALRPRLHVTELLRPPR